MGTDCPETQALNNATRDQHAYVNNNDDSMSFFSCSIEEQNSILKTMRAAQPIKLFHQASFGRDQYVVSTYDLVDNMLRDSENLSSRTIEIFTGGGKGNPDAEAIYATTWPEVETLFNADEPDHTRLRKLAQKAFLPGRIKRMADLIGSTIDDLIDRFIARGECDFLREFALPLPINSIGSILGIDPAHFEELNEGASALMRRVGQMGTAEEQVHDAHRVVRLKEFVRVLVEERRRNPADDLISDLVTAGGEEEKPFTDLELLSTVLVLIVAGSDTTRTTLLSTMALLLQNPDQLELLRNDSSLLGNAIDESLRFNPAAVALWRVAKRELRVGGMTIPKGGIVMLHTGSANRDERIFEDPDRFDILRPNANRHLTFGAGIHYCIGFRLAREQIGQSVKALLSRLNGLALNEVRSDLRFHPSVHIRCIRELHLTFEAAGKAA